MKLIYLNGEQEDPNVEHITFPTGERHIRINPCVLVGKEDVVLVYNEPSGEIMKLAMAVDICRRAGVRSLTLLMPFVPYARQDRVHTEGDPLSIKVFANLINSMGFSRVIISDPHSEVTPALLNNCVIVDQHELAKVAADYLANHPLQSHEVVLVAPDLGASKKIKKLQSFLLSDEQHGIFYPIIQCDKTRDPKTGAITGFKILDGDPENKHCLMVDDLCDGGGTFLGLSKVLEAAGAKQQSLYVTHGIFSKGTEILADNFLNVFCSDSFPQTDKRVVVIEAFYNLEGEG
jgi:ribose-phosphate pyrophosphokinase